MKLEEGKSKSRHGSEFTEEVLIELKDLRSRGSIDNIDMKKKFPFKEGFKPQFYAPFILTKGDKKILIFTMTSMRSDRNKINQWDAYGIRKYFENKIKVLVVLPDDLSKKEERFYFLEKEKIQQPGYLSAIDNICQLSDLKNILQELREDFAK